MNGWQRLWALLSVLSLMPTIIGAIETLPSRYGIEARRIEATIDAAGKYMESSTPGYTYEGAYPVRVKYYADLSDQTIIDRIHAKFAKKVDFNEIERQFQSDISALPKNQFLALAKVLFWWAFSVGFIYILGSSVGWVIRGFRRNA